jgi:hypothetical protein
VNRPAYEFTETPMRRHLFLEAVLIVIGPLPFSSSTTHEIYLKLAMSQSATEEICFVVIGVSSGGFYFKSPMVRWGLRFVEQQVPFFGRGASWFLGKKIFPLNERVCSLRGFHIKPLK